ncbi:MAG: hypothetical protein Fur0041_14030 [Bacteroidia bacterium]
MSREQLTRIYSHIISPQELENFRKCKEIDDDTKGDFAVVNEHIVFAYGVKHGYIHLSNSRDSVFQD